MSTVTIKIPQPNTKELPVFRGSLSWAVVWKAWDDKETVIGLFYCREKAEDYINNCTSFPKDRYYVAEVA